MKRTRHGNIFSGSCLSLALIGLLIAFLGIGCEDDSGVIYAASPCVERSLISSLDEVAGAMHLGKVFSLTIYATKCTITGESGQPWAIHHPVEGLVDIRMVVQSPEGHEGREGGS